MGIRGLFCILSVVVFCYSGPAFSMEGCRVMEAIILGPQVTLAGLQAIPGLETFTARNDLIVSLLFKMLALKAEGKTELTDVRKAVQAELDYIEKKVSPQMVDLIAGHFHGLLGEGLKPPSTVSPDALVPFVGTAAKPAEVNLDRHVAQLKAIAGRLPSSSADKWDASALRGELDQLEAVIQTADKEAWAVLREPGLDKKSKRADDAHDLKNVISPLSNLLQVLRAKVPARGEFTPDEQVKETVAKLRVLMRGAAGEKVPTRVAELQRELKSVAETFVDQSKVKVTLDPAITETDLVNASNKEMKSLFNNILSNAADVLTGKPDAQVTIHVRLADVDPAATPANTIRDAPPKKGKYFVFEIGDNGGGMSPDLATKVWKGHTTKEKGSGIGIPSARRIATDHGGFLEVETSPGEPTRFRLYLPAEPVRAVAAKPDVKPDAPAVDKKAKDVVIFDDIQDVLDTTKELLELTTGKEIGTASKRDAVLAQVRTDGKPQVFILDLNADNDPKGLHKAIKLKNDKAIIFVCTGEAEPTDRKILYPHADGWMTKPVEVDQLIDVVKKNIK